MSRPELLRYYENVPNAVSGMTGTGGGNAVSNKSAGLIKPEALVHQARPKNLTWRSRDEAIPIVMIVGGSIIAFLPGFPIMREQIGFYPPALLGFATLTGGIFYPFYRHLFLKKPK